MLRHPHFLGPYALSRATYSTLIYECSISFFLTCFGLLSKQASFMRRALSIYPNTSARHIARMATQEPYRPRAPIVAIIGATGTGKSQV